MSGDSSDDSGAESDIGEKMAQIHEKQLQQNHRQGLSNDDDDDQYDYYSSDEDNASPRPVVKLLRNSRRNSKASNSVDVKLQKLDFQQAQRARMHRIQQQQQRQGCASSDDDDDDAIQTAQNPRILMHEKKKAKHSRDTAIAVDDSDEDDNDDVGAAAGISARVLPTTQMGGTSMQDLRRQGFSANNAQGLQKLQAARVQLETISNKNSNTNPTGAYYDLTTMAATEDGGASANAGPQYIVLQVHATVRHQKDVNLVEHKQTAVTLSDTQNVQAVLDQVLLQWQYPAAQAVAVLRYQGQTLQHRFALAMYGMPTHGAIVELDLTLLDNNNHGTKSKSGSNSNSQPPMDVGPLIRVTLRCQKDTTVMKIGVKEPFQRLVERYNQKHPNKVQRLEFDGDTLPLHTTPAAHDMEDEDLIDVVFQT